MATGLDSAGVALQTLRANPLNTLLSTIGIVVGIAALVGILSFGDGMEQFAREQIMRNTDYQSIVVSTSTTRQVDGIRVPRSYPSVGVADARDLQASLAADAEVTLVRRNGVVITTMDPVSTDTVSAGAIVVQTMPNFTTMGGVKVGHGRGLTDRDVDDARPVAVVSDTLAKRLTVGSGDEVTAAIGRLIDIAGVSTEIVGILEPAEGGGGLLVVTPFTAMRHVGSPGSPPTLLARADIIEEVPQIAKEMEAWFESRYGDEAAALSVQTNEGRVKQVAQGVLLFKIIMGMIVGLSVLVGGIGVMNVLLMSVTERTREIGIRKAAGARRSDIVAQFLLESIAITTLGCFAGLALGAAVVYGSTPIIRRLAEMPFDAILSAGTVVVVLSAAVVLGLTFGTYPAWRASRLSPVEAIRRE